MADELYDPNYDYLATSHQGGMLYGYASNTDEATLKALGAQAQPDLFTAMGRNLGNFLNSVLGGVGSAVGGGVSSATKPLMNQLLIILVVVIVGLVLIGKTKMLKVRI